ncbi:MAG: PAS domain S-box protein [Chitinispirillaceae bacterium]|nr:PAS domain S-box protein [Chitinispirillaceae bacterium]
MNDSIDVELRCRELEEECCRLRKINEALMNRVEHCTDGGGSSFALFESNLLLHRQIKEHTSRLETINHDLQQQIVIRKKTENELKLERDFVGAILDNADVMVAVFDRRSIIVRVNTTFQKVIKRTREELVGRSLNTLFTIPDNYIKVQKIFNTVINGQFPYRWESEWELCPGEKKTISWSTTALLDENEEVEFVISCGIDITEKKVAEETRRLAEQRYRELIEFLPQTVYERDQKGVFTFVNNVGLRTFGYTRGELNNGMGLFDIIAPDDHEKARTILKENSSCKVASVELNMLRKDGTVFPAIVYSSPIDMQDDDCKARRGIVLDISNLRDAEMKLNEYRNHLEELVMDRTAELSRTIEQLEIEMSERKRIENLNKRQQEKLIQADKMATLGILVSGIAHEINNPNNFILLNSTNLLDFWKDLIPILNKYTEMHGSFTITGLSFDEIKADIEPLITGITEGAERIRRIVQSLKDFARKDSGCMDQNFNINNVIETSIIIMNNLIKKSTNHFSVDLDATVPEINGNFQQVEQVIINLITNACQALTDKKQMIKVVSCNNPDNKEVVVEVCDQGSGVALEHRKHILDPFFTTKRDSGGTGLGLSISYNIIKDHHWELTFDSEPGNETVFRITIPYQ